MVHDADFQLLDFGNGRKLERFGKIVLDRPCSAAVDCEPSDPALWSGAVARYERISGDMGRWRVSKTPPISWTVRSGAAVFELFLTEFGHLGIFPEQAENWDWIGKQVAAAGHPLKILNLFAYTGGSTFAAAGTARDAAASSAGNEAANERFPIEVVHVDAAKNTLDWARSNAELSGLADAPIRWICEDAPKFVARELKRGNRYDAVVLDPPSFGRGPTGNVWKFAEHLPDLLANCVALTGGRPQFMLLTGHTTGVGPDELRKLLANALGMMLGRRVTSEEMCQVTPDNRRLASGAAARFTIH